MKISPAFKITPIIFFLLIFISSTASAHRVSVFAYVEGDTIYSESYFSKSKKVHKGKITVFELESGKQLLEGETDNNGNFNFSIPAETRKNKTGLKIILKASQGHMNDWVITKEELFPHKENTQTDALPTPAPTVEKVGTSETPSSAEQHKMMKKLYRIENKLDAIKRILIAEQEKGPGITEIISGLGYILGLFGIAAFVASRKK